MATSTENPYTIQLNKDEALIMHDVIEGTITSIDRENKTVEVTLSEPYYPRNHDTDYGKLQKYGEYEEIGVNPVTEVTAKIVYNCPKENLDPTSAFAINDTVLIVAVNNEYFCVGFPDRLKLCGAFVLICADDKYCFIWDIENNDFANLGLTYPCLKEDAVAVLQGLTEVGENLFTVREFFFFHDYDSRDCLVCNVTDCGTCIDGEVVGTYCEGTYGGTAQHGATGPHGETGCLAELYFDYITKNKSVFLDLTYPPSVDDYDSLGIVGNNQLNYMYFVKYNNIDNSWKKIGWISNLRRYAYTRRFELYSVCGDYCYFEQENNRYWSFMRINQQEYDYTELTVSGHCYHTNYPQAPCLLQGDGDTHDYTLSGNALDWVAELTQNETDNLSITGRISNNYSIEMTVVTFKLSDIYSIDERDCHASTFRATCNVLYDEITVLPFCYVIKSENENVKNIPPENATRNIELENAVVDLYNTWKDWAYPYYNYNPDSVMQPTWSIQIYR